MRRALSHAACATVLASLVTGPARSAPAEEAAAPAPKEELSLLVAHGIAYARQALRAGGALAPYAFVMRADGGVGEPADFGAMPHETQQALRRDAKRAQPVSGRGEMVQAARPEGDDDGGSGGSALDLMRKMKKR